jgi:hypothetical protein
MRVIKRAQLDIKKWDYAVENKSLLPYSYPQFLDAVTSQNWSALIWGDYEAILPFYTKKKWGWIPYVYMPPFTQQFSIDSLTLDQKKEALAYFKKNFFKVDINTSSPLSTEVHPRYNYELKLDKSYKEIKENYNSLLKKNLLKFEDVIIEKTAFELEYLQFYFENPFYIQAIKNNRSFFFDFLMQLGDSAQYYKATYEGEIIALLITYKSREREFLIMPISTDIGKKYQAMSFLIDYVIQNSMSNIIDFEGSSIPNIANFYEQFGAKKTTYYSNTFRIF